MHVGSASSTFILLINNFPFQSESEHSQVVNEVSLDKPVSEATLKDEIKLNGKVFNHKHKYL